ncbi:MAG: PsbP-related protein [bacterium]
MLKNSSAPSSNLPDSNNFYDYDNIANGIRIKYPATWLKSENPNEKSIVCFFPPDRYNKNRVDIAIIDVTDNEKLNISGEETTLSNNPATKEIIFVDNSLDPDSILYWIFLPFLDHTTSKILQIKTIKDNKLYIITYFSKNAENYDNYIDIVNEMINSFTIY